MTKPEVIQTLSNPDTNAQFVYDALLAMYARQTASEQAEQHSKVRNNQGFGHSDAAFLSSVDERSKPYKRLTVKQCCAVAKCLKKYAGQIADAFSDVQTTGSLVSSPVLSVAKCEYCEQGFSADRPNEGISSRDYHGDCKVRNTDPIVAEYGELKDIAVRAMGRNEVHIRAMGQTLSQALTQYMNESDTTPTPTHAMLADSIREMAGLVVESLGGDSSAPAAPGNFSASPINTPGVYAVSITKPTSADQGRLF